MDLCRQILCLELLISRYHQQVKCCLVPVAQEQILADGDTQRRIHGVEITRTGSEYTFRRKVCEQRTWADRMYLYPIPQSELYKNPNLAPQNTGW